MDIKDYSNSALKNLIANESCNASDLELLSNVAISDFLIQSAYKKKFNY